MPPLHSWCLCLLIAVGYYFLTLTDRQDAQQALTKQMTHVEPNDPDSFIIALLDVGKKKRKKKNLSCCSPPSPPGLKLLLNVAAERELSSGSSFAAHTMLQQSMKLDQMSRCGVTQCSVWSVCHLDIVIEREEVSQDSCTQE